ncbi:MAG: hypothetical protein FJZ94_07990 [Chloroflexi bacterium]|nr:hypothetical protein [Chloroflexota bacterium]
MMRGKPTVVGRDRVSIRVQISREDYRSLCQIAENDRTDISSLVRRAIARYYLVPNSNNADRDNQIGPAGFGNEHHEKL